MTFKRLQILKKLLCRPGKTDVVDDEENTLSNDLVEKKNKKGSNKEKKGNSKKTPWWKKQQEEIDIASRYYREMQEIDPFVIKEVDGKFLDIRESLTPRPKWWIVPAKFLGIGWSVIVLLDNILDTFPRSFYLATFDHWTMVLTVLYLCSSFLQNAVRPSSKKKDLPSEEEEAFLPNMWHKINWSLFATVAPAQLLTGLFFWAFTYKRGDELGPPFAAHASIPLLVLFEGLCVNRTPLRVNHQWFFCFFVYTFLVWSLIHSYTKLGNPANVNENDKNLYPFLKWNEAPFLTVLYSVICLFLVIPATYAVVWMLSLLSPPFRLRGKNRRYLDKNSSNKLEISAEMES